jgi:AcrR family transcriptional regulator
VSGPVPPVGGEFDDFDWRSSETDEPPARQLELDDPRSDQEYSGAGRARYRGTRVRAGNAMGRTRASLLDAAVRLLAERGTKRTSMTDIAQAAGIAKGTLYNHFRNRDEVFAALVESEVVLIAADCRGLPLEDALALAALRLGTHPALRRVAAEDPALLSGLISADCLDSDRAPQGWQAALAAAADVLADTGRDPRAAELVVRWLVTHLTIPDQGDARASARLLAAVLPLRTLARV